MKRSLPSLLVLLGLLPFALAIQINARALPAAAPAAPAPTPGSSQSEEDRVETAVLAAVEDQQEQILGFLVNEVSVQAVQVSADHAFAAAWLVMNDPESGEPLPSEPGLALAWQVDGQWQVTLPADKGWVELLQAAPDEVLAEGIKQAWLDMFHEQATQAPVAALTGYRLPWAAGETVWLSRSVGHDADITSGSAHFAFDFYVPQTMFRLYAAKAGTVWRAKWDTPNNDHGSTGNYLVLQDLTTGPPSYQLYLHLAQGTIPPELRETGATVVQGQFIGLADNTGQSSGHHLHYQVHTNPNSYWGTAVDITFEDVDINGGRPRRSDAVYNDRSYCKSTDVCNEFRSAYVSGHVVAGDTVPPTGGLLEPLTGEVVKNGALKIEAWATDEGSGLEKARLLAYYNDLWQEIGGEYTENLFSMDWDLCAAGVPDGPVSLALHVWDKEGNLSFGLPGLTHFVKDFDCAPPPPDCSPQSDQVALFSAPDFGGECIRLGTGEYPDSASFGALGDDNLAAVRVGSQVLATLYTDAGFAGRGETLAGADANLADNPVGTDTASSLKVRLRSEPPPKPTNLVDPENSASFSARASLSLSWRDPGGATEFQAQLLKASTVVITSGWLEEPVWRLNGLALEAGTYTWKVRASNCELSSCRSGWSGPASFTLTAEPSLPSGITAPFSDGMESGTNGWTASGLWNRLNDSTGAHDGNYSWYYGDATDRDYKDSTPNSGDLTSRPITIPGGGYTLRFWYRYQTEGPGSHWDQRWVQISADGGPFTDLLQLWDDAPDNWLRAEIDLSAYAGQTVQVRFHFSTLDGAFNGYEGWHIDDVEIADGPLPACTDSDNQPSGATALQFDQSLTGSICPSGDVDYYVFNADAGDRIAVDIDSNPNDPPEDLDLILFLLDGDGVSGLAQHDDEVPGERYDPHLGYRLTRNGTYFLKVRQWSHPTSGGEAYSYSIRLSRDGEDPTANFGYPASGSFLPEQFELSLSTSDSGSGVSHVEFRYHSADWLNGKWESLGTDWDGSDGWSYTFDAGALPEGQGLAFFAGVYDQAGNWTGTGAWNLGIDRTAPATVLQPLEATQASNAVLLAWTASDNLSGLDYFTLQSKKGSGAWTAYSPNPDGSTSQAWFVGDPGSDYSFRMRGIDRAGNQESYPVSSETSTNIPAAATLCAAPDPWDSGKNDNGPATATAIQVDGNPDTHNFCNPLESGWREDEDWVRFDVTAGELYILRADPVAVSAAVILELYAADGTTLLAQASANSFGQIAELQWKSDRNGRVYLRFHHFDGRVIGAAVTYRIVVTNNFKRYLPFVNKEVPGDSFRE